jgi:Fe-S cluster assembly iron-binding protein IscA
MAKAAGLDRGVRVGVKNGGCAGMAYTMEYATESVRMTRSSRTRACAS